MTKNRLSKVLAGAGVASRRTCEEFIFDGRVTVNGKIVKVPQTMVSFDEDSICVDGKSIKSLEKKLYFILNKPKGYLCSHRRTSNRTRLVFDLFEGYKERLFTAGRLDKETEGMIIVTNDGHFANRVIHPSSNILKEYVAKTDHELTDAHLKLIAKGTRIEGKLIKPKKVIKVRKGTIKVVVSEGKKHEVRILLEAAGLQVYHLKRTRIGGLSLGNMAVGTWRELSEKEREQIFQ